MYAESVWFDFKLVLFAVFLCVACSPKLEIRDDLPDSAFACMQHYTPGGDLMIRASGEPSPPSSFLTINDGKSALEWRKPDNDQSDGRTRSKLVWISGSEETTLEPSRGIIQKINLWFFSLLPIEEQL